MIGLPKKRIEAALDGSIAEVRSMAGGDICQAFRVRLEDGRELFVKTRAEAPPEMFPTEARGLKWLAETEALSTPRVIAAEVHFLALEFVPPVARRSGFEQELGRGLARLHRYPAEQPGWPEDNFIGPLPQTNAVSETMDWPDFYAHYRLAPRVEEAIARGSAPASWRSIFERLYARLPELLPGEPLSRLHGDLWGGNLHVGREGEPMLIDPSVYVGHREVDLAMMRLFGGFSAAVFESYHEAYPLLDDWNDRVDLYQLYPLLVHTVLFGGSYAGSVERVLKRYVA